MGKEERQVKDICFIDMKSGETISSWSGSDITCIDNDTVTYNSQLISKPSASITIESTEANLDGLEQLFETPSLDKFTAEFDGDIPVEWVQARTNKKKRINKKWLKRYGMKVKYKKAHVVLKDLKAEDFNKDTFCNLSGKVDSIEFVKNKTK